MEQYGGTWQDARMLVAVFSVASIPQHTQLAAARQQEADQGTDTYDGVEALASLYQQPHG